MNKISGMLFVSILYASTSVYGYETDTHAYITAAAWRQSVLAPNFSGTNEVWVRLGLERRQQQSLFRPPLPIQLVPMDDKYLDGGVAGPEFERPILPYEEAKMAAAGAILSFDDARLTPLLTPLSLSG